MKKVLTIFLLLLLSFVLLGCNSLNSGILTTESTNNTDTTMNLVTTLEPVTETEELSEQLAYIYNLAVESGEFTGTYEEWLESIKGEDGREVTFRVQNEILQWQYVGDSIWIDLFDFSTMLIERPILTVTFESMGAESVSPIQVTKGDAIPTPPVVSKEGYEFFGWYYSYTNGESLDELWSFSKDVVVQDMTLYAKWVKVYYTVTFNSNGGTLVDSQTNKIGNPILEPANPTKNGFGFYGWFIDQTLLIEYNFAYLPEDNITLYAKWGDQEPLANPDKDYYVTGNFNGWDTKVDGIMTAIPIEDERITGLLDQLVGVEFLYIFEATLPSIEAGWGVRYIVEGVNTYFDGNLTVKVIRTLIGYPDSRDWWAQSPESGEIINLTPDTLFIPEYVETATTTVVSDNGTPDDITDDVVFITGAWNDNIVALEAGTYYVVFAEFEDGTRAMGLIPVI
jgi:uncharacterized repeat protein (TIGR02543 family)